MNPKNVGFIESPISIHKQGEVTVNILALLEEIGGAYGGNKNLKKVLISLKITA